MGAMKRGWGTCCTFKVINLTYLHVLRAGMVYIKQTMVRACTIVCSDHSEIYAIAIAGTNIPLSSARTWTLFHQPQKNPRP